LEIRSISTSRRGDGKGRRTNKEDVSHLRSAAGERIELGTLEKMEAMPSTKKEIIETRKRSSQKKRG